MGNVAIQAGAPVAFLKKETGIQRNTASVVASERPVDSLSVSRREKADSANKPKVVRNAAIGAGVVLAAFGADILFSNASRFAPGLIGRAFLQTPAGLAIIAGLGAIGATIGANWHRLTGNGGK